MQLSRLRLVAYAVLVAAGDAMAQGCSMCYASSAQQSPAAQQALNLGIIVLIIPPVLLFAGVMITAFRRGNDNDALETSEDHPGS